MGTSYGTKDLVILLLTSGFFIAGLIFDYMPAIVDSQIKRTVELATNDEIKAFWTKPPIDFHSYYWLYDVTNPEEFMAGQKLKLRKVGPFHFTTRFEKKVIEITPNKYRVIYNSTRHLYFNESLQVGANSLSQFEQEISSVNPIYAASVENVRQRVGRESDQQINQMSVTSINKLTEKFNETLLRKTTPRELLLGRHSEFLAKIRKMLELAGGDDKLPDSMNTNTFGIVSVQNGTWTGPYEIYSGYQATASSLGDLISFEGRKRQTIYRGVCNRLQASAGELRPMPLSENQRLEMFQSSLCRVVYLNPMGNRKIREGPSTNYMVAPENFASAQSNPDKRCYCVNATGDDFCSLDGVLELAPCLNYAPIVLHMPHVELDAKIKDSFADWDKDLVDSSIESVPRIDNNNTHFIVLRRVGIPIRADATFVMFLKVSRDSRFRQTVSIPEVNYIPLVMFREVGSIPANLAQIIVNLESFLALAAHLKVIMYLSSVVLLCWLTGYYYNRSSRAPMVRPSSGGPARLSDSEQGGVANGNSDQTGGAGGPASKAGAVGAGPRRASIRNGSNPSLVGLNSSPLQDLGRRASSTAALGGSFNRKTNNQRSASVVLNENDAISAGHFYANLAAEATSSASSPSLKGPMKKQESLIDDDFADELAKGSSLESSAGAPNGVEKRQRIKRQANRASLANINDVDDEREKEAELESSETNKVALSIEPTSEMDADLVHQPQQQAPQVMRPDDEEEDEQNKTKKPQKRNWIVRVASNFVRMLNSIRTSIQEAGQLDLNDAANDDFQDKQLEQLAGKIENWTTSTTTTTTDGGGATSQATSPVDAASSALGGASSGDLAASAAAAAQAETEAPSDIQKCANGTPATAQAQAQKLLSKESTESGLESTVAQETGQQQRGLREKRDEQVAYANVQSPLGPSGGDGDREAPSSETAPAKTSTATANEQTSSNSNVSQQRHQSKVGPVEQQQQQQQSAERSSNGSPNYHSYPNGNSNGTAKRIMIDSSTSIDSVILNSTAATTNNNNNNGSAANKRHEAQLVDADEDKQDESQADFESIRQRQDDNDASHPFKSAVAAKTSDNPLMATMNGIAVQ